MNSVRGGWKARVSEIARGGTAISVERVLDRGTLVGGGVCDTTVYDATACDTTAYDATAADLRLDPTTPVPWATWTGWSVGQICRTGLRFTAGATLIALAACSIHRPAPQPTPTGPSNGTPPVEMTSRRPAAVPRVVHPEVFAACKTAPLKVESGGDIRTFEMGEQRLPSTFASIDELNRALRSALVACKLSGADLSSLGEGLSEFAPNDETFHLLLAAYFQLPNDMRALWANGVMKWTGVGVALSKYLGGEGYKLPPPWELPESREARVQLYEEVAKVLTDPTLRGWREPDPEFERLKRIVGRAPPLQIALLDTGTDPTFPCLAGVRSETLDRYLPPVGGPQLGGSGADAIPPDYHGTSTACLTTAGIQDVALLSARAISRFVPGDKERAVAQGLTDLVERGSRVVNMSLGPRAERFADPQMGKRSVTPAEKAALLEGEDGIVVDVQRNAPQTLFVIAAGNDGIYVRSPAANSALALAELPNQVFVAAAGVDGLPWRKTNYGADAVWIAARGGALPAVDVDGTIGFDSGTSLATPFGSRAEMKGWLTLSPGLTPTQAKALIGLTRDPHPAWSLLVQSGGLLNEGRAMRLAAIVDLVDRGSSFDHASSAVGLSRAEATIFEKRVRDFLPTRIPLGPSVRTEAQALERALGILDHDEKLVTERVEVEGSTHSEERVVRYRLFRMGSDGSGGGSGAVRIPFVIGALDLVVDRAGGWSLRTGPLEFDASVDEPSAVRLALADAGFRSSVGFKKIGPSVTTPDPNGKRLGFYRVGGISNDYLTVIHHADGRVRVDLSGLPFLNHTR